MSLDEQGLHELLEESEICTRMRSRVNKATMPDLADHAADTRNDEIDPADAERLDASRHELVADLGDGGSDFGLLKKGALAGGIGAVLTALLAGSAAADQKLDVQILQTASSLEILAVATYGAALTLPFIKNGNAVVKKFAQTTLHAARRAPSGVPGADQDAGRQEADQAQPEVRRIVTQMKPSLKTPADVVTLAATLETVATETYLSDLAQLSDAKSKALLASVMGVECQHLATLRAVGALLAGGADDLIAIPTDVAMLPAAAGSVAFPDAFEPVTMASPPQEGAIR